MIYTITLNDDKNNTCCGTYVSLLLKKKDIESIALGIIPNDYQKAEKLLDDADIKHDFIKIDATQLDLFGEDKQVAISTQQKLLDNLKCLNKGDILVICGSFAKGISPVYLSDMAAIAHKKGAYLVVSVPYATVMDILPLQPFLIQLTGQDIKNIFDKVAGKQLLYKSAHYMVAKGASHVLCMLDKQHIAVINMTQGFVAEVPDVKKVSGVGCQESLLATFLTGILKNHMTITNLANSVAAYADSLQKDGLTDYSNNLALQRKVIAQKIMFDD